MLGHFIKHKPLISEELRHELVPKKSALPCALDDCIFHGGIVLLFFGCLIDESALAHLRNKKPKKIQTWPTLSLKDGYIIPEVFMDQVELQYMEIYQVTK